MAYDIQPLTGIKSLRAFGCYHTLLLGIKMTPLYIATNYSDFLGAFEAMKERDKEKILREACLLVPIEGEEVEALCGFVKDENGIAIGRESLKSLTPDKIIDILVAVCLEFSRIKVFMVNDEIKKN